MGYAPAEMMDTMPPEAWLQRYVASEFGQYHALQPLRYSVWAYDREQKLADLGLDVDPVGHMVVNERMVRALRQFDDPALWSPEETYISSILALTHEFGECTHPALEKICGEVVGDIPHGQKTEAHRAAELKVWWTQFHTHFPEASDELVDRLENLVAHREDSYTHHAQEGAHAAGFFRTGLRAGRIALRERAAGAPPSDRLEKLGQLAVEVTGAAEPKVQKYAKNFAYVDMVVTKAQPLYRRIQEELA